MFDFIQENKPDKIKRSTLTNDYSDGGLNMIDIGKFIISLKASWIKRLFYAEVGHDSQLKAYYDHKLNVFGGNLIFESSLSQTDIKALFKKCSFLRDIILSWMLVKNTDKEPIIDREILWNNSNIKIDKKTVFFKSWFEKGIKLIKHIFDYRTKDFYSFKDMVYIFNIPETDFLKYNSLKYSIPKKLKLLLNETNINQEARSSLLENMVNSKQVNKLFYTHQLKSKPLDTIKSEIKWNSLFENQDLDWNKIYTNVISATIDIKLRAFQYKFLHRITPTNKLLFKQNLTNSNLCDFCSMHIETLQHLYWDCMTVQTFWTNLKNKCNHLNIRIAIDLKSICFGEVNNYLIHKANNFIIFCAKYYIFICKCRKTIPNYTCFKNYLSSRLNIEKQISFQQGKLEQHNTIWGKYLPLTTIT